MYWKNRIKGVRIGTASRVAEILIEDYKVAVVPCQDFGFDNFIRLSYAISMENIKRPGSHRGIRLFFVRAENSLCKRLEERAGI